MASETPTYLTPQELAARWRIGESSVYRLLFVRATPDDDVPAGKLLATRIGGQYRIDHDVLLAFEAVGRLKPATQVSPQEQRRAMRCSRNRAAMAGVTTNLLGL